ncbi:DUF6273 domain-containing protein [Faecalispora sporosphaeroides]|uniref:DUF6273 domain-containing protein n=1 Tax=Faecalispora sporosphaeroides TaxID=1549 RepID=UPI00036F8AC2|nr:DUF6273 domain-containing protein [Faecalispora sporosphaeroides]
MKELYAVSGGVNRKIFSGSIPLSSLPVGTKIKLKENGAFANYIAVNQGKPSSIYDDSCDGIWFLRESIYETRQWHSSNVNNYANSTIKTYLNGTFLALFDSAIQNAIKQVKIPYRPGSGTSSTVNSGSSGLSCKIFLLSGYEMGWTSRDSQYFPAEGAKLSYFDSGTGTTANNKRIAYLSGSVTYWWLRSPFTYNSSFVRFVNSYGDCGDCNCSFSGGVRPALVLDFKSNVLSTPDTDGVFILDV